MTEETPQDSPGRGQLMEEAALWFARMRGPEADMHRAEFEAWLARGALHRSAYNRAAEIFSLGKFLHEPEGRPASGDADPAGDDASDEGAGRGTLGLLPFAAIGICLLVAICVAVLARPFGGELGVRDEIAATAPHEGVVRLKTRLGEVRAEKLADGSQVTLQSDSVLVVSFDPERRDLRLIRGAARFDVAHGTRPFVVAAGAGTVTARGTVFDVTLGADQRVTVRLLRGKVDVVVPGKGRRPHPAQRLEPGQTISFAAAPGDAAIHARPVEARPSPAPSPSAAGTMREYRRIRLADLLAQANAGASVPIRLAEPALGDLMVSGHFRIDDTQKLADRLAWIFNLRVGRGASGELVLSRH